jgi:hypothetical protein
MATRPRPERGMPQTLAAAHAYVRDTRRERRRLTTSASAATASAPPSRSPGPSRVVVQPAHPPRFDSDGGADCTVGVDADPGDAPGSSDAFVAFGLVPPLVIARSSRRGSDGAVASAHSGQASRTRRVASSAFARPAMQRSPGSSAQILSAARRIDARARHAVAQSDVESASCCSARLFSSVVTSSFAGAAWARALPAHDPRASAPATAMATEVRVTPRTESRGPSPCK